MASSMFLQYWPTTILLCDITFSYLAALTSYSPTLAARNVVLAVAFVFLSLTIQPKQTPSAHSHFSLSPTDLEYLSSPIPPASFRLPNTGTSCGHHIAKLGCMLPVFLVYVLERQEQSTDNYTHA